MKAIGGPLDGQDIDTDTSTTYTVVGPNEDGEYPRFTGGKNPYPKKGRYVAVERTLNERGQPREDRTFRPTHKRPDAPPPRPPTRTETVLMWAGWEA